MLRLRMIQISNLDPLLLHFILLLLILLSLQIWFKNRRAKFRKEKRTCVLNVNKDFSVQESNSVLPVSPVCCQVGVPWLPILAPHDITPSTTGLTQGDTQIITLLSSTSLSSPTSSWELAQIKHVKRHRQSTLFVLKPQSPHM